MSWANLSLYPINSIAKSVIVYLKRADIKPVFIFSCWVIITLRNLFLPLTKREKESLAADHSQSLPAEFVTTAESRRTWEGSKKSHSLGQNHTIVCPITLTSQVRNKRDVLLWIPSSQSIHECWKATVKRAFPLSSSEIGRDEMTEHTSTLLVRTDSA